MISAHWISSLFFCQSASVCKSVLLWSFGIGFKVGYLLTFGNFVLCCRRNKQKKIKLPILWSGVNHCVYVAEPRWLVPIHDTVDFSFLEWNDKRCYLGWCKVVWFVRESGMKIVKCVTFFCVCSLIDESFFLIVDEMMKRWFLWGLMDKSYEGRIWYFV
jgi:hypothetical protein